MGEGEWALIGVLVGSALTGLFSYALQDRQFKHNKEMFLLNNKSKEAVKNILEEMLNHRTHTDRSFEALKKPIGGYSDEEIRKFLHELNAKKVDRNDGSEWWYLLSRRDERNEKRAKQNT
ncbi:MAG: hypothetical protein K6L76_14435 [Agarilytica sp.]